MIPVWDLARPDGKALQTFNKENLDGGQWGGGRRVKNVCALSSGKIDWV